MMLDKMFNDFFVGFILGAKLMIMLGGSFIVICYGLYAIKCGISMITGKD